MHLNEQFIPPAPLDTAVLFLVFNRLDVTKQVFGAIKQAKPPRLYVASDGPRNDKEGELDKVEKVRKYILDNINWPCEIKTLFRDTNLGCKYAVSGAIDWFFDNEEQGIILEDDCLPSQSFFWYCESLLEQYQNDDRIFLVSGYKKNFNRKNNDDYFFSNLGGIWGWASWKRAWKHYDVEMSDIDSYRKQNGFNNLLGNTNGQLREKIIMSVCNGKINTWDYQWAYARHKNNGLACIPRVSLIENVGFGPDATHTKNDDLDLVIKKEISFPLKENVFFVADKEYDTFFLAPPTLMQRVVNKLKKIMNIFISLVKKK